MILTGAGISTSLGVPDFRSENGVYKLLENCSYDEPQELFHIDNFKTNPEEFWRHAAVLFPKMQGLVPEDGGATFTVPKFSPTHAFIAMLQAKDKLLTNYTQNIDNLEVAAGISSSKLIQCHGSLATASCLSCNTQVRAKIYMRAVRQNAVPFCRCIKENGEPKLKKDRRRGRGGKKKRKRDEYEDTDSEDTSGNADFPKGLLRPDMTFFGEDIAASYAPRLKLDKSKVDLLVIIGTSLKVAPVNEMQLKIPPTVPQIFINKERCARDGVKVDIELRGECDLVLEEIARRAGWEDALKKRLWKKDQTLETKSSSAALADPTRKRDHVGQKKGSTSPVKAEPQALLKEDYGGTLTVKPERPLQIRQKSDEISKLAASQVPKIVITSSDEKPMSSAEVGVETKRKVKASEVRTATTVAVEPNTVPTAMTNTPSSKMPINTTEDKNESARIEKKAKPPSPSKVIVELDLGAHNVWYFKRAK